MPAPEAAEAPVLFPVLGKPESPAARTPRMTPAREGLDRGAWLRIGLAALLCCAAAGIAAGMLAIGRRRPAGRTETFGLRPGGAPEPALSGTGQPEETHAGDVRGTDVPSPEPAGARVTPAPWSTGFATHPSLQRDHNEDMGAAFGLGGYQVAIVADGVGGMPLGGEASALAVRAAEASLRRGWRLTPAGKTPAPSILLHGCISAAAEALAAEGARRGFVTPRDGLRTTLIVAIATPDRYHFAYIGDGGLFAVRADGGFETLMTPHKAEGGALNQLAASLGPFPHRAPVFGAAARGPGDLLVVATDGVADRAAPRFYTHMLMRQVQGRNGDLTGAAERVLTILANHREGGLHRFDDNMTLALIGGGEPPMVSRTSPAGGPQPEARHAADTSEPPRDGREAA